MPIEENQNIPPEKLLTEIVRLKRELKQKKLYGLVWDDKIEEVVELCKEKLPVLKEIKDNAKISDISKPVNFIIELKKLITTWKMEFEFCSIFSYFCILLSFYSLSSLKQEVLEYEWQ